METEAINDIISYKQGPDFDDMSSFFSVSYAMLLNI
jgi:hypothetical protein